MSWTWRYERSDGSPVTFEQSSKRSADESFPSQSDAETWIGEVWKDLLDDGVDQVTLLEDARVVYGPMSLHPPG